MYNIGVVGCGAIGLTTAVEIQKRFGHRAKVTIFADKFSPNTTSDIAAGLWEPYLLAENSEKDVIRWSRDTFRYILKLWQEARHWRNRFIILGKAKDAGICLQPAINLFNCKNYFIPKWVSVTLGYNELHDRHLESLSKQYNQRFTGGFMFVGFTWEPTIFLPYLQREFVQRNGTIIERHIERLNELEEFDVIVNCTGFEARHISSDEAVVPIRGQVMRVEAPWQYIIYLVQCDEAEHSCYVIPNRDSVVLGGTSQPSFDTRVNTSDTNRILRNVSKICPSVNNGKVVNEVAGLRPSRYKVRLEEEFVKTKGRKTLSIVHNYGHGGAGITLSVGCANEAADLVEKLIKAHYSKL